MSYSAEFLVQQINNKKLAERQKILLEKKLAKDREKAAQEAEALAREHAKEFFEIIAEPCLSAAIDQQSSCAFLKQDTDLYETLILSSGFDIKSRGTFSPQQLSKEFPELYSIPEVPAPPVHPAWGSHGAPNSDVGEKMDVTSIEWGNKLKFKWRTDIKPLYPFFSVSVLHQIFFDENKFFREIFETINERMLRNQKSLSIKIQEFIDGQCTADVISGWYLNDYPTTLSYDEVVGIFDCLGFKTAARRLTTSSKDPDNLESAIEIKISW